MRPAATLVLAILVTPAVVLADAPMESATPDVQEQVVHDLRLHAKPPTSKIRRYAIILGVNQPARDSQKPLRFADDDAVRFYSLFREFAGEASLFALLDDETQTLYPEVVSEAELPSEELLQKRLDEIFARMKSDGEQGIHTEFYFVYSGHGYVDDHGEGHLGLHNGTFSRSQLYDRVLAKSSARVNHVIIDACDAYFFVQSRGDTEDIERLLNQRAQEFLDRQTLSNYPNTGAILSTASAAETHEWSEIKAGVFSHGVRSALLGAADADENGRISYDEIEAFVLAASAGVRHANASRAIFVRAPERDHRHPVLDLNAAMRADRLHLSNEVSGRIALADDRGRRYADLNKAAGYTLALRLLPGPRYFVRLDDLEYPVPGGQPDVQLASLAGSTPSLASRGAGIAEAYAKGLFAVPFGPQLVRGFQLGVTKHNGHITVEPEESNGVQIAALITGGAAIVAAGVATGAVIAGNGAHDDYLAFDPMGDPNGLEEHQDRVRAWDGATQVALGAAISLGVTSGILFLVDALD